MRVCMYVCIHTCFYFLFIYIYIHTNKSMAIIIASVAKVVVVVFCSSKSPAFFVVAAFVYSFTSVSVRPMFVCLSLCPCVCPSGHSFVVSLFYFSLMNVKAYKVHVAACTACECACMLLQLQ